MRLELRPLAVLFDLDGTLVDTAPDMVNALNCVLSEQNRPAVSVAAARNQVSNGAVGLLRLVFGKDLTGDLEEELRQRFLEHYARQLCVGSRLFDGFGEVLAALAAARFPWGIVTNKPGFLTRPLLNALGLDEQPRCVISGDTLAQRKPHPAPLLRASADMDLAPGDCIYVGDALHDVQAAQAAGMPSLVAAYGYIESGEDPRGWGASGIIESPLELIPGLLQSTDLKEHARAN